MRRQKIWSVFLWAAGVIVVLFVGKWTGVLKPIEWIAQTILTPAQSGLYKLGITVVGGQEVANQQELTQENQGLKDKINNLLVENTRLHTALSDVGELQSQLDRIAAVNATGIPAKAVGRGLTGDQNSLEINAGADQGITEGSAVIGQDGVLIGRILRVDAATSIVTLLTSPSIAIAAEIQNDIHSPGVVSGEHGLGLRMTLIPQTDLLQAGDIVVTSGTDSHIPEQIVIGTITTITSTPGGLFQEATLTPLFDPQTIRLVTVVIK